MDVRPNRSPQTRALPPRWRSDWEHWSCLSPRRPSDTCSQPHSVLAASSAWNGTIGKRNAWLFAGGVRGGLACVVEYQAAVITAVVFLYVAARGARGALVFACGVLPGVLALALYNVAAFDSPLHLSYRYVASERFAEQQAKGLLRDRNPRSGRACERFDVETRSLGRVACAGSRGDRACSPLAERCPFRGRRVRGDIASIPLDGQRLLRSLRVSSGPRFFHTRIAVPRLGLACAFERWRRLTVFATMISIASMLYQTATWSGGAPLADDLVATGAPRFVAAMFVCSCMLAALAIANRTVLSRCGAARVGPDGAAGDLSRPEELLESCRSPRYGRQAVATDLRAMSGLTLARVRRGRPAADDLTAVVPTRGGAVTGCKTDGSARAFSLDAETFRAARATPRGAREWMPATARTMTAISRRARSSARPAEDHGGVREAPRGRRHPSRPAARRPSHHATHLLTRGVLVHIVEARLGHASPVTTMQSYAHVLPWRPTSRRPRSWPRYSLVSKRFAESPQARMVERQPRRAGSRCRRSPRPTRRRRRS